MPTLAFYVYIKHASIWDCTQWHGCTDLLDLNPGPGPGPVPDLDRGPTGWTGQLLDEGRTCLIWLRNPGAKWLGRQQQTL